MIERSVTHRIISKLNDSKVLVIIGPRQSGKSTMIDLMKSEFQAPVLYWNGDEFDIRNRLENTTSAQLKKLIGNYKTIIIDEAQRIKNIGITLKLMADQIKGVKVIATGSSAFELTNKTNEPLTGRKWEFKLFPLSFGEMVAHTSLAEEKRLLHHRLVFGYYPDIINHPGSEIELLKLLTDSYLYKDILMHERIQKPSQLEKLIQALAFQVGQLISYNELGQLCGLNNETVEKYISLLEKAFVVFRLPALSRNPRNELKKSFKLYFYDNGFRNAVINQFNPITLRQDVGAIWENFFVSERLKFISNRGMYRNLFFWRTLAQQEVDYLEESNGNFEAFECKWNIKKSLKITRAFTVSYPDAIQNIVTPANFDEFLQ